MKKNTLIRNDSPHAVKMREGSNVAERKVKKVAAVKEPAPKVDAKVVVKPAPKVTLAPTKIPKRSADKARPNTRLKTTPPATVNPVTPNLVAAPAVVISAPPVLDEATLWEQDNPVKSRLAQLRTRNALLDEQLQRLKTPFHARGKKS